MIKQQKARQHFHYARIIFSGILLCQSLSLLSCQNSNEDINNITGANASGMQDKAQDVKIYYSDKGQIKAIIYAKEFTRNETAQPAYTDIKKSLKVEFLNDSQKVESTLTAKSARIFENESNVIVRDDVCVVNKKGEKLNTEELVWNQKLDKFYTDKKVTITTPPNQVMYGNGLEANADFSWYKISNLKGNIAVENKDGIPQ